MNLVLIVILAICIILLVLPTPKVFEKFGGYADMNDPWETPTVVDSLLTDEDCKEIIKLAEPKFERSKVVGSGENSDRTSETAWISKSHPMAQKILLAACELAGKDLENCEDLQVVRYTPGTFYRPHHDSCCDDTDGCREFEKNGGQRVGTLIMYLNNDFTEGRTHFPNLNKMFRAPAGSGLFFRPMDTEYKKCHTLALHGGMPPTSGTKYLCNAWIREGPYSAM
jgi:prolyl 4-hydroxylase